MGLDQQEAAGKSEKRTNVICKEEANVGDARLQTEKHQNVKDGKIEMKLRKGRNVEIEKQMLK